MEKNKVIIDWLSVSSKMHSPDNFMEDLGLAGADWQLFSGYYGYRDRFYFEGISIHYNGHKEDMGILLEMSGQGCRSFETFGNGHYESLFSDVKENPGEMNITRLDIAFDDFEGLLNLRKVAKKTELQEYVSPLRDWRIESGSKGLTVSLGSKKSDTYIRIYDKALERGYDDGRHWVRCELQLRRQRAHSFAMLILEGKSIGDVYAGVMYNYLRYIELDASRKERCSTSTFLEEIFEGCRED